VWYLFVEGDEISPYIIDLTQRGCHTLRFFIGIVCMLQSGNVKCYELA